MGEAVAAGPLGVFDEQPGGHRSVDCGEERVLVQAADVFEDLVFEAAPDDRADGEQGDDLFG